MKEDKEKLKILNTVDEEYRYTEFKNNSKYSEDNVS